MLTVQLVQLRGPLGYNQRRPEASQLFKTPSVRCHPCLFATSTIIPFSSGVILVLLLLQSAMPDMCLSVQTFVFFF